MCQYSYYHPGYRTFGGNIPGYAQGGYFPGDEPGTRCRFTDEPCANSEGDTPTKCSVSYPTEWLCPECQKEGCDSGLWKIDGKFYCTECESGWTEAELPRAYASLLVFLTGEIERAGQSLELLEVAV